MFSFGTGAPVVVATCLLLDCCGDSGSSAWSGAGAVSCEYEGGLLHYCNEFKGVGSESTGCVEGGGTPGTGCSRTNLAGSCKNGSYQSFFYGASGVTSAVDTVCPDGTYQPADAGDGVTSAPQEAAHRLAGVLVVIDQEQKRHRRADATSRLQNAKRKNFRISLFRSLHTGLSRMPESA